MTNSEYLLIQMFAQIDGMKFREDEILIMFNHLYPDEPVDPGVPDDFNF